MHYIFRHLPRGRNTIRPADPKRQPEPRIRSQLWKGTRVHWLVAPGRLLCGRRVRMTTFAIDAERDRVTCVRCRHLLALAAAPVTPTEPLQ